MKGGAQAAVRRTCLAGALGGLAAYGLARPSGTAALPELPAVAQAGVAITGGAGAAWVGIYALAAADPQRRRTWLLAALCGLSWQPAVRMGRIVVSGLGAHRMAREMAAAAQSLKAIRDGNNAAGIEQALREAVPAGVAAIERIERAETAAERQRLLDASADLVRQVAATGPATPRAATAALERLGIAAASSRQGETTGLIITALSRLRLEAPPGLGQQRLASALRSIAEAARQSRLAALSQAADSEAYRAISAPGER